MSRAILLLFLLLSACAPAPAPQVATLAPANATTTPPTVVPTANPTATLAPAAPEPTPLPQAEVCSPLDGIALPDLPALISNPYHPPRAGSDDPHHGVDFADTPNPNRLALGGRGVRAAVAGTVVAVVADRFPYGNAVIIETPLQDIPPVAIFLLPTPSPTITPPALTCPPFAAERAGDPAQRSAYVLYAHMENPPSVVVGDAVSCGQPLGAIGQSGNALNPHLHIEVRVGPAGARPGSLAHYTDAATLDEMAAYCAWRVSGLFAMTNPMLLFGD